MRKSDYSIALLQVSIVLGIIAGIAKNCFANDIIALHTCSSTTISVDKNDTLALVALYHATYGPNWIRKKNWLDEPVSTWGGITMENGRVTSIFLGSNNESGYIPSDIGILNGLQDLRIFNSQINCTIPKEIGNLINLHTLELPRNPQTGSLPPQLGELINLTNLGISSTQISGSIPSELGKLAKLKYLNLINNKLAGSIPVEWVDRKSVV